MDSAVVLCLWVRRPARPLDGHGRDDARTESSRSLRSIRRMDHARRRSVRSVLRTRRPSETACRLDSPNIRSFSTEGTSVIRTPAAAKRQLMTVSISKPSPHTILPSVGAGPSWSGRSSSGIRSAQNAL